MPTATMAPQYPFSVTFHGKNIVEVRQGMVNFLADNVTSTAGVPEVVSTPAESPEKKPRKTAKKTKSKTSPDPEESAPSVSADKEPETTTTDGALQNLTTSTDSAAVKTEITPDEHPNVSLAYNNALEQLMQIYNASPEGAYEVTLLLENYRVVSFREIPEDRGIELLDKAEAITTALEAGKQKSA